MIATIIKGSRQLSVNTGPCAFPRARRPAAYVLAYALATVVEPRVYELVCLRTFVRPRHARTRVPAQRAYVRVWSLNLLHLCSAECIYMKRRLTFLFLGVLTFY